jgi:hypothetical protein
MLRLLVNDDAVDMAARAMSLTVTHLAEIGMGPVGLLPLAAGDRL